MRPGPFNYLQLGIFREARLHPAAYSCANLRHNERGRLVGVSSAVFNTSTKFLHSCGAGVWPVRVIRFLRWDVASVFHSGNEAARTFVVLTNTVTTLPAFPVGLAVVL